MTFERETGCHDFARRFDSFLDGEMDAHSLRGMALHASHCAVCGQQLERAETVQELLLSAVESEVERLDTSRLWSAISARLEASRPSLGVRLATFREHLRARPIPALALVGALAVVVAALLWPVSAGSPLPASEQLADNHAQIERIESNASHVAVWSEPSEHTTAIWVASYEPEGAP